MIHLLVVDVAVGRVRVKRYEELSRRGRPACMPRRTYEWLIAGLPSAWREAGGA